MANEGKSTNGKPFRKKAVKPAALIILGIIIAFPIFSITYYTMARTSTPQFCASCYEIQWAYDTWKTSTHVNNAQGFVADCMDWLRDHPAQSVDLVFGSPPYAEKGERYGTGSRKWSTEDWVEWMLDITVEAVRLSKGYVVWIANGAVRRGKYLPAYWL